MSGDAPEWTTQPILRTRVLVFTFVWLKGRSVIVVFRDGWGEPFGEIDANAIPWAAGPFHACAVRWLREAGW